MPESFRRAFSIFDSIASSLRAWIKPKWILINKSDSLYEKAMNYYKSHKEIKKMLRLTVFQSCGTTSMRSIWESARRMTEKAFYRIFTGLRVPSATSHPTLWATPSAPSFITKWSRRWILTGFSEREEQTQSENICGNTFISTESLRPAASC